MDCFESIYDYFEKELPDILCQLPLFEEKNIGIYGTGIHTERLIEQYETNVGEIKAKLIFIDSTQESLIEKYNGCYVYNVCDIGKLDLDAIILSSFLYEKEMLQIIQKLYGDKFPIYRFYEDKQEDIFLKEGIYLKPGIKEKKLKINFADFWFDFKPFQFFLTNMLIAKYKLIISDNPDILFCSYFGNEHKKYKNCKKIFIVTEPRKFDFKNYDYAVGYPYLNSEWFFHYNPYITLKDIQIIQDRNYSSISPLAQKKFCNFIYSNETWGKGAYLRKEFCIKLSEYKHIDCPGKVLNNMKGDINDRNSIEWANGKCNFIKDYKFTIAFENTMLDGYTTEKLWDPLRVGSIPIYWGNPLIGKEIHSDTFINCNDFDNDLDAVIKKVKEIDNDDEYYIYMRQKSPFKQSYSSYVLYNDRLMLFLDNIISEI